MKTSKQCYAIVVPCDGAPGQGRPMVIEQYLDEDLEIVERRARHLKERFGDAIIIELPIMLQAEVISIAGSQGKVMRVQS